MYNSLAKSLSRLTIALFALCLFAAPALAGSAVWSTTNVQFLYGEDFELGDTIRTTLTVEHANGWKYGDNFFFLDVINPNRQSDSSSTDLYAEFSPRLSISKMTGANLAFGPIKDVLLAGTVEMGNGFHNYLYGLGLSLDLPKFAYFDLNVYVRNNLSQEDTTYQVTPCWALPFSVSSTKLLFEGFADIAGKEGNAARNIDFQPRLLVDVGNYAGAPDSLWVGIEYIYWNNKFGVEGVDEHNPQAMVKWVF